jgi:hypothetical protein
LNAGQRLAAVWDGRQYVLFGAQALGIGQIELRARRLLRDVRTAGDGDWFPVAGLSGPRGTGTSMDAVALGPGALFVAYEQLSEPDTTDNVRVRARAVFTPPLDPAPAAADAGAPPSDAVMDAPPPGKPGGGCSCGAVGRPAGRWAGPLIALAGVIRRGCRCRRRP